MTTITSESELGELTDAAWEDPVAPCPDPLGRSALVGLGALFLLAAFIQAPGSIVDDTKLPVLMTPLAWMESALHLWNRDGRIRFRAVRDVRLSLPDGAVLRDDARAPRPGVDRGAGLAGTSLDRRGVGRDPHGRGARNRKEVGSGPRRHRLLRRSDRRRLGDHLGGSTGRRVAPLDVGTPDRRLSARIAETCGGQVRSCSCPDGGGQRHRDHIHASPRGDLVHDAGQRHAAPAPRAVVVALGRAGLLLVARPDLPAGQVRVQLPALHRDRPRDDGDRACLRGASWRVELAEL